MSAALVDVDRLDRDTLAAVSAGCARNHLEVVSITNAREHIRSSPLIVGVLKHGERRLPHHVLELMTQAPAAAVLLFSDDALVRPSVATHRGRVTLLAQPASPARVRGTLRMLLSERSKRIDESLDARLWTASIGWTDPTTGPAWRRDGTTLTVVFPLQSGWSGARELCDDADLIAQAQIDEEERHRRLREVLGNAAGMIHLTSECRQWVTYWPSTRSALLLCSPVRLPRICNIADGVSKQISTLSVSAGDLLVAMSTGPSSPDMVPVADGGGAFVEYVEASVPPSPVLVVEVR